MKDILITVRTNVIAIVNGVIETDIFIRKVQQPNNTGGKL